MTMRFLPSLWKELRQSSVPLKTKIIVCSMVVFLFICTLLLSSVAYDFVSDFLAIPVNQAKIWHVLVLMGFGFVMFGRNK